MQDENRRLRDAVKIRNRKIKELSGGKVSEVLVTGNGRRTSIASLSTDETLPPEKKDNSFGDWMSSVTCSLKARKCNWF